MKHYLIIGKLLILILLTPFLYLSCTKHFDKLNEPQGIIAMENLDASYIGLALSQAQYRGLLNVPIAYQTGQNLYADLYVQYFATCVDYFSTDQFVYRGDWADRAWTEFYSQAAPQLFFLENYTAENDMPLENAITKVWKVMMYHRITDYWGPIIYSNFGNTETSVAYDAQRDIYLDFFKLLDEAVSVFAIHGNANAFGSNDLLFAGNINKWYIFANSLRLRLAIRIAYIEPLLAQEQAEKAVLSGVMANNTDNAALLTTDISRHPHEGLSIFDEYRMSAAIESFLMGYNDPRIGTYFSKAVQGQEFKGLRNGADILDRTNRAAYSQVGQQFMPISQGGSNPDIKVMNAAEVYFLRAEGALRGWNMGGPVIELYNEGIRQSLLAETNVSEEEINSYINSLRKPMALNDKWDSAPVSDVPIAFESSANTERQLEQIITQKWIALFPDGWEAWSERRRTGYPKLYPIINSLDTEIPETAIIRRLSFVPVEYQNNTVAIENAITLLGDGGDGRLVKLWWDAKP